MKTINNMNLKTIKGPNGLVIELDRDEVYPDDPGQGTPAMVYRNKNKRNECSGTYWCVVQTAEFIDASGDADPGLTAEEIVWLDEQLIDVEAFLYPEEVK